MFSALPKTKFSFSVRFILLSAFPFNMDQSKNLPFGKEFINNTANHSGIAVKLLSFNTFPNKPWFLLVCSTSLLKTLWEKEKLLVMSNFSFYHSVFYPFEELPAIFVKFEIVVCKVFRFGKV